MSAENANAPSRPREMSLRTRSDYLDQMSLEDFDLVVIGGGITGAGVALDAAARGLKVALIEKSDFASGTSSRSSKLIHGGLRYLEQMQFGLVRESLHERGTLLQIAPHLARKLAFVVPVYDPPARSPLGSNKLKLSLGLTLYDLFAGRENLGRHFWLPGPQAISFAAGLESNGLRGCFVYYDCLTDDSRLVIEVIKEAAARGAKVANYATVHRIASATSGFTLEVEDLLSHRQFELKARAVVNATGVWSTQISGLSGGLTSPRPSKGVHIVVPFEKVTVASAVLIPSLGEDRFLFVIPWLGRTLIGTTDNDYSGDLDDPKPTGEEIDRLVQSTAACFPSSELKTEDVISSFAGLRPLVASRTRSTKDLSRKELIIENQPGVISVIGGKLTTYRRIAERVVDQVYRTLGRAGPACLTKNIGLAGERLSDSNINERLRNLALEHGVEADTIARLMSQYGGYYETVLGIAGESDSMKRRLAADLPNIEAEAVYSSRFEMAATAEDFLHRRSRIALLARDQGQSCAAGVSVLLAAAAESERA